jgi:hypothetical protein
VVKSGIRSGVVEAKLYDVARLKGENFTKVMEHIAKNLSKVKRAPAAPSNYDQMHSKLDVSNLSPPRGETRKTESTAR